MKEMVYTPENKYELLHFERKLDYDIVIISLGNHPCAYVSLPPTHILYQVYYGEIPEKYEIYCHGGLTFSNMNNYGLRWEGEVEPNEDCSWIGWDYGHCDDFEGYYLGDDRKYLFSNLKKWTTQEILDECYNVIDQLEKIRLQQYLEKIY